MAQALESWTTRATSGLGSLRPSGKAELELENPTNPLTAKGTQSQQLPGASKLGSVGLHCNVEEMAAWLRWFYQSQDLE